MNEIAFEKWQGLGNDFVLIEAEHLAEPQAVRLCDRRLGIGADGILLLRPLAPARWAMTVLNADGSRPEMCGNGLRCAAARALELQGRTEGELTIETDAGARRCEVVGRTGAEYLVEAEMGVAIVGEALCVELPAPGGSRSFVRVDVGNPHAVSFEPFDGDELASLGPRVERQVRGGTNVELCRATAADQLDLLVWERGVGLTQACGTGACAATAAAAARGLVPYGRAVQVCQPGGSLEVTVTQREQALSTRGPARRVFVGRVRVD